MGEIKNSGLFSFFFLSVWFFMRICFSASVSLHATQPMTSNRYNQLHRHTYLSSEEMSLRSPSFTRYMLRLSLAARSLLVKRAARSRSTATSTLRPPEPD